MDMRRNKRSENKIKLLKETESACAHLAEKASRRETVRKIETNRRAAFNNFTRAERFMLENEHKLNRVKSFSEYLLKTPKFFDEPSFHLEYCRNIRAINIELYARLILIGFHWWLYMSVLVSCGSLVAVGVYILLVPLLILLLFRRDI